MHRHKVPSFFFLQVRVPRTGKLEEEKGKKGGEKGRKTGGFGRVQWSTRGVCMWWWCNNKAVYSKLAQRFGAPPRFHVMI